MPEWIEILNLCGFLKFGTRSLKRQMVGQEG